jgi:hypothetical protein
MSSSACVVSLKEKAVGILKRLYGYHKLCLIDKCNACQDGLDETVPNADAIGPFFCQKHQTPMFKYIAKWEPFHFEPVENQPVTTTALITANRRDVYVSVRTPRECRDCKDSSSGVRECAPRGLDPHEIGPFLCEAHATTVFICCKKDNAWEPLWFNSQDE